MKIKVDVQFCHNSGLTTCLKFPQSSNNDNQQHFHNFFTNQINILHCKFKVPRRNAWNGHPFYYEILKSFDNLISQLPISAENILSIPIWYNRVLNIKFDSEISRAGFNYLKDIFTGQLLDLMKKNKRICTISSGQIYSP